MKKCSKCKYIKYNFEFGIHSRNKDGLRYWCKECEAKYNKIARQSESNKESRRLASERYRLRNHSKVLDCVRKSYYKNRDRYLLMMRERNNKNKKYMIEYRKRPENKLKDRIRASFRRSLIRTTSDGTVTYEAIMDLLNSQNNLCAICGCDLKELPSNKINLDHIFPISKGGLHSIYNLQWTCQFCNFSKGAKVNA